MGPIESNPAGSVSSPVNPESAKALTPILEIPLGKVNVSSDLHLCKVYSGITVILFGKVTEERCSQSWKTPFPREVTLSGNTIVFISVPAKA